LAGFNFRSISQPVAALAGNESFGRIAQADFVSYLRAVARQQPAVLFLEDLHWADDASLDLVAHLVEQLPKEALYVVGLARPEFFERRRHWGEGQAAYSRIELQPLSRRASRQLVAEILQKAPQVPESLHDLVVEGAEGNPLFVEELIKMLIDDGAVVPGPEAWQIFPERLAQTDVPPTLTGVLQARLDSLPPEEKAVLQRAAVVGRIFWDRLVGELAADALHGPLEPLLSALRERELVFHRERSAFAETEEFIFKHAILRDVTYETVLLKLRRRYHAQVAAWLEMQAGERLPEYYGMIAGHYEQAGDAGKAADYLQRSGDEAMRLSAYRDARTAFERGLQLLSSGETSDGQENSRPTEPGASGALRSSLLVGLGMVLTSLGEYETAAARLEEGQALAETLGEDAVQARALIHLGRLEREQGAWAAAGHHLQAAQALADRYGDRALQALALTVRANVAWAQNEGEQALLWAEQARALFQDMGDRQGAVYAMLALGTVSLKLGKAGEARAYYRQGLVLARELGDRGGETMFLIDLAVEARQERHAYDEAHAFLKEAWALSEEIADRPSFAYVLGELAELSRDEGGDDEAWVYLKQSLRLGLAGGMLMLCVANLTVAASMYVRGSQPEQAAELLGLVKGHPATPRDVLDTADQVLAKVKAALPPARLEAALRRGAALDLGQVITRIAGT
jgi:tetratricopeptide (TPR) repeat protein